MKKHFDAELIATEYANQYPEKDYHDLQHAVLYGIIQHAKHATESQWIDVKEQLPLPSTWEDRYKNLCIVYCDRGSYGFEGFGFYGECLGDDLGWHILAEESRIMQSNLGSVTHYTSFPERP